MSPTLSILALICGTLTTAGGLLIAFAGGMSDAPVEGAATGRTGCTLAVVGVIIVIAAIVGLFIR